MSKRRDKPDREKRRQQRRYALGTRDPACVACGETDDRCLLHGGVLEKDHVAGKKHHPDIVLLCRNCHAKKTDSQIDHFPYNRPEPRNELAMIGFYLLGICELFELLAQRLREFGTRLISLSEKEDQ